MTTDGQHTYGVETLPKF